MTNEVEIFFEDVPQQQNVLNVSTSVNESGESELIVGLSAYQIAVNRGFVGTVEEWLLSLKGEKGDQGIQGERGASDTDAAMLEGQNGAFYLNRANHTGSQAISTVTDLQTALETLTDTDTDLQAQVDLKLDAADYNDRFLGLYASFFELEAAHPTASAGDYAQVDWGVGVDVIVYAWDVDDTQWIPVGSSPIANTDALPEGSTNLYFTSQRVRDTPLTGLSTATAAPITAADSVLSAAAKLQAQISAGGASGGGAYIAGRHYGNQKVGANLDTDQTRIANLLYLTPYYADSDVTITKWAVTPTSSQTGRQYKGAVYKVTNGSLIRITPEQLIGNSAIARVFFEQSFSLKKGELCFFAFLANGTSPYQCVNRTVALNIGSVNGVVGNTTLVTYLLIDTTFASGLADTYALAQTIEQINPPQHVVFQVA